MTILPQLEHDLLKAAREQLPAAASEDTVLGRRARTSTGASINNFRRRLATTGSWLPAFLAITVTIAVAAFALSLARRTDQPRPRTPAVGVASARQQLIQTLGVLRRAQTKSDLDPELLLSPPGLESIAQQFARRHKRLPAALERQLVRWGNPKIDKKLARVVHIPAWEAKVGIQPTSWQPSPASHQRSEGVQLSLWIGRKQTIPPSTQVATGPPPTSLDTVRKHGLAVTGNVRSTAVQDGVVLVPDGVARITLQPIRVGRTPVPVNPSAFGSATGAVSDNIATFQMPIPTITDTSRGAFSGLLGTTLLTRDTWYGPNGNVIKQTTTAFDVLLRLKTR
jgi:hypothetical protein